MQIDINVFNFCWMKNKESFIDYEKIFQKYSDRVGSVLFSNCVIEGMKEEAVLGDI